MYTPGTLSAKNPTQLDRYEIVRRTVSKHHMRDKVWAVATYAHPEGHVCQHTERVLYCVGVEGPQVLRLSDCFLEATAVYPADCPECGLVLEHGAGQTEYFDPPIQRTSGMPFFRIPGKSTCRLFVKAGLIRRAEFVDPREMQE